MMITIDLYVQRDIVLFPGINTISVDLPSSFVPENDGIFVFGTPVADADSKAAQHVIVTTFLPAKKGQAIDVVLQKLGGKLPVLTVQMDSTAAQACRFLFQKRDDI